MLCLVTSRNLSTRPLWEVVAQAVEGGVDMVQVREKDLDTPQLLELATRVNSLCLQAGAKCIINSNLEVAHHIGAAGIHLGVGSPSIKEARQVLGDDKLVGVSIHSLAEAISAQADGANYLIAGHIYSTQSKPHLEPRGLDFLQQVSDAVDIPVYAIGGITPERVEEVLQAGAKGVALLSGIMAASQPKEAAIAFKKRLNF